MIVKISYDIDKFEKDMKFLEIYVYLKITRNDGYKLFSMSN